MGEITIPKQPAAKRQPCTVPARAEIKSSQDLAIVYNNRCYVYMRLGQARTALDD